MLDWDGCRLILNVDLKLELRWINDIKLKVNENSKLLEWKIWFWDNKYYIQ